MKFLNSFLFILLSTLVACNTKAPTAKNKFGAQSVCAPTQANTSIKIGVKGMVCLMGCGSLIRKSLKQTCAVESVSINYIDTLMEQTIIVKYDRKKIAPKQMLSLLQEINDHQFEARAIGSAQSIQ